ncbi:MAG: molybdopterin-binding protein, partial [Thermoplasmatota archaeon]
GEVLVHGIAVKPGKPTLIGKVNNKLVLGLPGYPTSALSNFYILVVPLIERMVSRTSKKNTITAPLSKKIVSTIGRYEFLAVKIENKKAVPVQKGSSAITTLAEADGFIEIDENTEVLNKGENVDITLF